VSRQLVIVNVSGLIDWRLVDQRRTSARACGSCVPSGRNLNCSVSVIIDILSGNVCAVRHLAVFTSIYKASSIYKSRILQKGTDFHHSYIFERYCATLRDFVHQIKNLPQYSIVEKDGLNFVRPYVRN
jgi:hypothetical protein